MRRPHVPIALPVIAVILIVLGAIANRWIPANVPPERLASNVLISAIPFILIFVGILLLYITFIVLVATALNNAVSARTCRIITRIIIAGILLGIIGMFQPWAMGFYTFGFVLVLISTLSYIVWSHVTPAPEPSEVDAHGHAIVSGRES